MQKPNCHTDSSACVLFRLAKIKTTQAEACATWRATSLLGGTALNPAELTAPCLPPASLQIEICSNCRPAERTTERSLRRQPPIQALRRGKRRPFRPG